MERVESHVTVPPSEITIESDGEERSGALTVTEDVRSQVRCVTRLSNPAPRLSWRLAGKVLTSSKQREEAELGVRGKVRTEAVLEHQFTESDLGASLECVVSHPAYSDGNTQSTAVTLDVICKCVDTCVSSHLTLSQTSAQSVSPV